CSVGCIGYLRITATFKNWPDLTPCRYVVYVKRSPFRRPELNSAQLRSRRSGGCRTWVRMANLSGCQRVIISQARSCGISQEPPVEGLLSRFLTPDSVLAVGQAFNHVF